MANLKLLALLIVAIIAVVCAVVFAVSYFPAEAPTPTTTSSNNAPDQFQPTIESSAEDSTIDTSDSSLFTNTIICKAITHAIVGAKPAVMKAAILTNKIVISLDRETDGNSLSYNCKQVDNRFYWSNSSRVLSQSIIEVDAKVIAPRLDQLKLFIYESLDTGNIVKTYNIEELR